MNFQTEQEALAWFEREERILTPEFIASIKWEDIPKHQIAKNLIPVLQYMRDIEAYTEVYYEELMATPTGKNPAIRAFMERWVGEEPTHARLLHRFLEAAAEGTESLQEWKSHLRERIPASYTRNGVAKRWLAKLFGKRFGAIHMVWGAINEHSTLVGYKRLWEQAKHPVLEQILRGIVREEARHALFYWSVARIYLQRYKHMRPVTRFVVNRFWSPVGQGIKPRELTDYVVNQLFHGKDGVAFVDKHVNDRIAQLPGLEELHRITDRIAEAAMDKQLARQV